MRGASRAAARRGACLRLPAGGNRGPDGPAVRTGGAADEREQPLGAITLGRAADRPSFAGSSDIPVAEELGRQLAAGLVNADQAAMVGTGPRADDVCLLAVRLADGDALG